MRVAKAEFKLLYSKEKQGLVFGKDGILNHKPGSSKCLRMFHLPELLENIKSLYKIS